MLGKRNRKNLVGSQMWKKPQVGSMWERFCAEVLSGVKVAT